MTNTNQAVSQQKKLEKVADQLLATIGFKTFKSKKQERFEKSLKPVPIFA